MKLEFDVWKNANGEIHLTCNDKRLGKPINIRAKFKLESTAVLERALFNEKLAKENAEKLAAQKQAEDSIKKEAKEAPPSDLSEKIKSAIIESITTFGEEILDAIQDYMPHN